MVPSLESRGLFGQRRTVMAWLMMDDYSLITLWGYHSSAADWKWMKLFQYCTKPVKLRQYIFVTSKIQYKYNVFVYGWHSHYKFIPLLSAFILCSRLLFLQQIIAVRTGGVSLIPNGSRNQVVPWGWTSTKASLGQINASWNLLILVLHTGIPRPRIGWGEMPCRVSPYGITVGTCIFLRSWWCSMWFTGTSLAE